MSKSVLEMINQFDMHSQGTIIVLLQYYNRTSPPRVKIFQQEKLFRDPAWDISFTFAL